MTTIAEFLLELGFGKVDTKPLTDAEREARESADKIGKAWDTLDKRATRLALGITGVAAGLLGLAANGAAAGAAIDDVTKRAGVGATEYQRLKFGLEQSGGSAEGLAKAFTFLSKTIVDARDKASPAAEAFKQLGLAEGALEGKSAEQRFEILADAFAKVEDSATRTDLALTVFGKAGGDLVPLLAEGAAGVRALGDEAERLGVVLDESAIAKAAEFDDELAAVKSQLGAVVAEIGIGLIPIVRSAAKDWQAWGVVVGGVAVALGGLKLAALAQNLGLVGTSLAAVKWSAGIAGALGLGVALGTALDNALGLSDALAGLERGGTSGKRGAPSLLAPEDSARRNELTARRAGILDGSITDTGIDPVGQIDRELAALEAKGRARAEARKAVTERATKLASDTVGRTVAASGAAVDQEKRRAEQARLDSGAKYRKKGAGGKRATFTEDIGVAVFEADDLFGEELRRLAASAGVGEIAVDQALRSAAASMLEGASMDVARQSAIGRLASLSGKPLGTQRQSDPLLSALLGENVPDVALSSIALGATPQTLISTINNTFTFDNEFNIDGAGDPSSVGTNVAQALRDVFQGAIEASTKTAKVVFVR